MWFLRPLRWHFLIDTHWHFAWPVGLRDAQRAGRTLYLGVSVRVCLEEISIWICGLSKEDHHRQCGRQHPIHWGPEQNKQGEEGKRHSLRLSCDTLPLLPSHMGTPGSQNFGFGLEPYHQLSRLLACRYQIWGLVLPHNCMDQFLLMNQSISLFLSLSLSIYIFIFMYYCFFLFIDLFISGCVGSLLLRTGFL